MGGLFIWAVSSFACMSAVIHVIWQLQKNQDIFKLGGSAFHSEQ